MNAVCDYCGLPTPRSWWSSARTESPPTKQYCCFGCRFAAAVTSERGEHGAANWTLTRLGFAIFLSLNVMVFTMALWTQDFYGGAGGDPAFTAVLRDLFRYLCLLFSLPVLLFLGGPLLENAWADCRRGALSSDLLLVLGVAASYLYSAISVLRDDGPVYFEIGCAVLVLVTLGRWLEATCKLRTTAALEGLHRLLPDQARLSRQDSTEECVPLDAVAVGDCLRVWPGERIPCDGVVLRNSASVDEQALTGESQPAVKEPGSRVFGGSLNLDGDLFIRVTAAARAGALARMIELVRQARQSKGHYERLADRVTAWFLPAMVLIALATLVWHTMHSGANRGILASLAVVLIACPCALGLATPLAVWSALGRAARVHIVFRNGEALERLASVQAVRFDKTGTLTTGNPSVVHFVSLPGDEDETPHIAASLTAASSHSYAGAIRAFVGPRQQAPDALAARTLPGLGIVGEVAGRCAYLGSQRLMALHGLAVADAMSHVVSEAEQAGKSLTCLGWDGAVRGIYVFREELRPEAAHAVAELRGQGIHVAVLTGDSAARGAALAREMELPVLAALLPEDKVAALADARRHFGPVAMVGDGINDAPALAASDVGIALGCGTDVSRESANVCLLGNDLRQLPFAVLLARRTVRVIRQNLFWAFAYNILGVGLACTGRLNPVFASLAMVLSSFLVVTNSLRLGAVAGIRDESRDSGPRKEEDKVLFAPLASVPRPANEAVP